MYPSHFASTLPNKAKASIYITFLGLLLLDLLLTPPNIGVDLIFTSTSLGTIISIPPNIALAVITASSLIFASVKSRTTLPNIASILAFLNSSPLLATNCSEKIAVIAAGSFFGLGQQVADELKKQTGIKATLINPRYLTGIDKELLEALKKEHKVVITLEDGELDGGFGEKVSRFYGNSDMKVLNFGAKKEFTDRVPIEELYKRYHLTKELIVQDIKEVL